EGPIRALTGRPRSGLQPTAAAYRGVLDPAGIPLIKPEKLSDKPSHLMPATIVLGDQVTFVTDPVSPCAGEDFTVSWQEKNVGDEASGEFQDTFDLDDQGNGSSKTLTCDPLEPGHSATRSLTFNLPAGNYVMTLIINAGVPLTLGNVIIDEC